MKRAIQTKKNRQACMKNDFTTVIALDRQHNDEFKLSLQTWLRFHPEILERPLLVIRDEAGSRKFSTDYISEAWKAPVATLHWGWPYKYWDTLELLPGHRELSQRERMLTALTVVPPAMVQTPYWLKIDTDTICTGNGPSLESFIEPGGDLIASPWGYTKPIDAIGRLNGYFAGTPMPEPIVKVLPAGDRAKHPRIISWLAFVRTDWSREAMEYFGRDQAERCLNLPVRSHDTVYSYMADRMGATVRKIRFKLFGFDHVRPGKLAAKVKEVLG